MRLREGQAVSPGPFGQDSRQVYNVNVGGIAFGTSDFVSEVRTDSFDEPVAAGGTKWEKEVPVTFTWGEDGDFISDFTTVSPDATIGVCVMFPESWFGDLVSEKRVCVHFDVL